MPYNITSIDHAQEIIDGVNEYHTGVEVDFCTYAPELNAGDTLVRVYADNDILDDGSKMLIDKFYMTGNTFNELSV